MAVIDEFALIGQLLGGLSRKAEGLLCGVGDDCAVFTSSGMRDWLVTTDSFVENVHFRSDWATWPQIGYKAVLAAVSDIAAMGGRARFLVIGLNVPGTMPAAAVRECFQGVREAAEMVGALVVGGDTSRADGPLLLNITVIGEVAHGSAIYRRGARVGDVVYVTGTLGASKLGLAMLAQDGDRGHPFVRRHLQPVVRQATGQWVASTGCVTSMIDVSDGLLIDLGHVAQASDVGIVLEGTKIPLAEGVIAHHALAGPDPLSVAVGSGEEYELAFTVAGGRAGPFRQLAAAAERTLGHPLTAIGKVVAGLGCSVLGPSGTPVSVADHGFAHQFLA